MHALLLVTGVVFAPLQPVQFHRPVKSFHHLILKSLQHFVAQYGADARALAGERNLKHLPQDHRPYRACELR